MKQSTFAVHRCRFVEFSPSGITALAVNSSGVRCAIARENGDIELWRVGPVWSQEKVGERCLKLCCRCVAILSLRSTLFYTHTHTPHFTLRPSFTLYVVHTLNHPYILLSLFLSVTYTCTHTSSGSRPPPPAYVSLLTGPQLRGMINDSGREGVVLFYLVRFKIIGSYSWMENYRTLVKESLILNK